MGCAAQSQVSNSTLPKQIQIITESGKKFLIAFDKLLSISQIKSHMEMRIASKSDHLRLYLKIEHDQNTDMLLTSSSKVGSPNHKYSIVQEGESTIKQIELDDNLLLNQYYRILCKNPCIYLSQDRSSKNSSSNESISTTVNSHVTQKNQTIYIGPVVQQDQLLQLAIERLESGEQITQSQINILQRQDFPQKQPQQTLPVPNSEIKKSEIKFEYAQINQLSTENNVRIEVSA